MMQKTTFSDLPRGGRIGRFIKMLKNTIDEETLLYIVEHAEAYDTLSAQQKSAWWKNAVAKMEQKIGTEEAVQVMTSCGAKCCGKGQRETAKRLMNEAGSLEGFLAKLRCYGVKEGDLSYSLEDENTIIAEHNKCFCKQVSRSDEPFDRLTYCQCSVEFNRQFFTAALEKPVQVELLQSIICGAPSCRFRITFR